MESMEYATRSENTAHELNFAADDFTIIMDESGEVEFDFYLEEAPE